MASGINAHTGLKSCGQTYYNLVQQCVEFLPAHFGSSGSFWECFLLYVVLGNPPWIDTKSDKEYR